MNEMNISSTRRRAYKATTNSRHAHPIAPNSPLRAASPLTSQTPQVGDITPIPTGEGWLYCAVVKDLCTKQIVGYAFSDRIDTNLHSPPSAWPSGAASLCPASSSLRPRRPIRRLRLPSAFASLGIRQSMSRKGDPYDNAVAENFFSCLMRVRPSAPFRLKGHAMADVFAYIETFTTRCARIPLLAGVLRMPLRVPCLTIPPPDCDTTRYPAFLSVFSSFLLSTKPEGHRLFFCCWSSSILWVKEVEKNVAILKERRPAEIKKSFAEQVFPAPHSVSVRRQS